MSKKVPEEKYRKTLSFRFRQWLDGTKDPFLGEIEMKPQKEIKQETYAQLQKREQRENAAMEDIHNFDSNVYLKRMKKAYRIFSLLFCIFLVVMLLIGVSDLPPFGNADNPVNNITSQRYIENGLQETGAVNIVTGMILDYRAFDTLGESHVLFIATCAVLILLRTDRKYDENGRDLTASDRLYEPKNDVILQTVTRILFPPIMIFGIYVILCGHLGPGGGFSGGAVMGAGLILYLNAFGFKKTERFFKAKTYKIMSVSALGCYALCKSYSFYTGANHIESIIPKGTPGMILSSGLILILNICVGIVVAGTMYTFYCLFRKGDY